MALNNTSSTVNNLVINIVDTNETFNQMQNANQVNANELYFISEEVAPSALSITLNGTTATYDTTSATTLTGFYAPTSVGTSGYILKSNGNGAPVWEAPYSYTLTTATSSSLGGIKIGYTTTGQNYAVQLSDGKAYVNVPWENTTYTFDGTYNASSNKAATVATVTNAINALDVTAITSGAANTITLISETNGKISATYSAISIAPSQINAAIPNSKLATSGISIAGTQVVLDGSITAEALRENLNLSQALRFIGVTSAGIGDGNNTIPTDLGITNYEPSVGDVVIDSSTQYEYVWVKGTGFLTGRWEKLGGDSSYKTVQDAVNAATTASTTATTTFVSAISQNSNGVISYTTKPVSKATTTTIGIVQLSSATNSTSTALAATPSAVKAAYDLANSKTNNTGTVTSITLTADSGIALNSTAAITTSGSRTISLANNYGDTKNPYGTKNANTILAGPASGSSAAPTFRALVADDIPNLTIEKISDFPEQLFEPGTGANSIVALNGDYVDNTASGITAFAGGSHSSASGIASFAYGSNATASGNYSVALGGTNSSINNGAGPLAQGGCSLAVGLSTQAIGARSVALGLGTTASGSQSVAMGDRTIAAGKSQTVIGQYNIEDTNTANEGIYGSGAKDYLFIIGNGNSTTRSNAFTVGWNGNANAQTSLSVASAVSMVYNSTTQALDFIFA